MSDLSTPKSGTLSGRTKEEIDKDFRACCRKAAEDILRLGYDLIEMKEILEHGDWLDWLKSVEWSERTAQNYMRVAKSWNENPKLMSMGYTRTVALLAAPAEVQEMAAEGQLDDKSAAEIKRLSAALRKAEEDAKAYQQIVRNQQHSAAVQTKENGKLYKELQELREREPEIRIVEKIPDDYELVKRQLKLAEDAAEDAERRAAEAVQQAQDAMAGQADPYDGPSVSGFIGAVNAFLGAAGHLPYAEDWLRSLDRNDRKSVRMFTDSIWHWAENMLRALEADRIQVIPGEGAVVSE